MQALYQEFEERICPQDKLLLSQIRRAEYTLNSGHMETASHLNEVRYGPEDQTAGDRWRTRKKEGLRMSTCLGSPEKGVSLEGLSRSDWLDYQLMYEGQAHRGWHQCLGK